MKSGIELIAEEKQLTNEEIVRVFAMYWGQEILCYEADKDVYPVNRHNIDCKPMLLKLKPLSAVTYQDAADVFEILNIAGNEDVFITNTEGIKNCLMDGFYDLHNFDFYGRMTDVFQHLLSKGFALPLFFGIDHWANGKTAVELGIAIQTT